MKTTFTTTNGLRRAGTIIAFVLIAIAVQAQDRIFTYTYESRVLGKGQKEIEIWNTLRAGRNDFYARYDHRTEFELGIGKNFQTAFYLNLTSKTKTVMQDTLKALDTEVEIGFSNEWKYKILDPVADPLGLAVYAEAGIASNEFELEGKLILDKKIKNLTIAANGVYELELKPGYEDNKMEWEQEHKADAYLALAYSFSPKFHLTMEHAYRNVLVDGKLEHSALYSGLGFSYQTEKFFCNLTVLPQITSFKGATGKGVNLNEFEKFQTRLMFAFAL